MGWLNSDDMHCPWALSVVADIFAHNPEVSWLTTRFPLRWDVQGRATACSDARGYARAAFARGILLRDADFSPLPSSRKAPFGGDPCGTRQEVRFRRTLVRRGILSCGAGLRSGPSFMR